MARKNQAAADSFFEKKGLGTSNAKQQKTANANNTVGVRFGEELLAALDGEVARRQKATPWVEITRADVVREAVYKLLGAAPAQALAAAPTLEAPPSAGAVCRICGDSLPEGRKAICAKESCFKDDKNARERERRKALRKA